jgi:hypothetical protein
VGTKSLLDALLAAGEDLDELARHLGPDAAPVVALEHQARAA